MGVPNARFQTFSQGDIPPMDFWNVYLQDYMVGLRADVDANVTVTNEHVVATDDAHGSIQGVSGRFRAPFFESTAPAEALVVDCSGWTPDGQDVANWHFTLQGNLYTVGDSTTRSIYRRLPLRPGDRIRRIELVGVHSAGTMRLELRRKDGTQSTVICSLEALGGTTNLDVDLSVNGTDAYQLCLSINNNGNAASSNYFHFLRLMFERIKR